MLLGVMNPLRDFGATNVDQLFELHSELGQALFRDVLSLVVHRRGAPFVWNATLIGPATARDKGKTPGVTVAVP